MRLHDFLDYRAREQGDALFAIDGSRRITYREAQAESNRLANAIVSAGLRIVSTTGLRRSIRVKLYRLRWRRSTCNQASMSRWR